jgi:hypothetical protein
MIELVDGIRSSVGVVPDELLGFIKLSCLEHRFGLIGFNFIREDRIQLMANQG